MEKLPIIVTGQNPKKYIMPLKTERSQGEWSSSDGGAGRDQDQDGGEEASYWEQWMSMVGASPGSRTVSLPDISTPVNSKAVAGDGEPISARRSFAGALNRPQEEETGVPARDEMRKDLLKQQVFQVHPLMTGKVPPWEEKKPGSKVGDSNSPKIKRDRKAMQQSHQHNYFGNGAKVDFYQHFKQISRQRARYDNLEELEKIKALELDLDPDVGSYYDSGSDDNEGENFSRSVQSRALHMPLMSPTLLHSKVRSREISRSGQRSAVLSPLGSQNTSPLRSPVASKDTSRSTSRRPTALSRLSITMHSASAPPLASSETTFFNDHWGSDMLGPNSNLSTPSQNLDKSDTVSQISSIYSRAQSQGQSRRTSFISIADSHPISASRDMEGGIGEVYSRIRSNTNAADMALVSALNEKKKTFNFAEAALEETDSDSSGGEPDESELMIAATARTRFLFGCVDSRLAPRANLILRKLHTTQISLAHQGIGDELGCIFAECLQDLPLVQHLNVTDCRMTDKSLVPLLKALASRNDILTLNLSENKMDEHGSDALMAYLEMNDCSLVSLVMSKSDIDDDECCRLLEALAKNPHLTALDLSHNLIGTNEVMNVVQPDYTTGGEAVAESVAHPNCRLKSLDLSWNLIRLESAVALGEALAQNSVLTELNISYNAFGKDGGESVGKSLYENKTLKVLNMSHNNITPRAAFVIAVALRANEGLNQLVLDGNPLGEYGGKALMSISSTAHHRIDIGLKGCNFHFQDDECWFNPENPEGGATRGEYRLDMTDAYEFAVMLDILQLASREEGFKIAKLENISPYGEVEVIDLVRVRAGDAVVDDSIFNKDPDEIFKEIDQDGSGHIDLSELKATFHELGLKDSDNEIKRIMDYYDKDQSGEIELDEFVDIVVFMEQEIKEKSRSSLYMARSDTKEKWQPPQMATNIKVKILYDLVQSEEYDVFTHDHRLNVMHLCENADDRAKMIEMTLGQVKLQTEEAELLYGELLREYGSQEKAMEAILPSMAGPHYARLLLATNIKDNKHMRLLRQRMGASLPVLLGINAGHYRLDLTKYQDRLAFRKVVEINNMEKKESKASGRYDTSQNGTWDNFRNIKYNFKKMPTFARSFMVAPPHNGFVEFDYVSTTRPHFKMKAMNFNRFCTVLRELELLDDEEASLFTQLDSLDGVVDHPSVKVYNKARPFYIALCKEYGDKLPGPEDPNSEYCDLSTSEEQKSPAGAGAESSSSYQKPMALQKLQNTVQAVEALSTAKLLSKGAKGTNIDAQLSPREAIIRRLLQRCQNKEILRDLLFNTQLTLVDRYFTSQQIRYLVLRYHGSMEDLRNVVIASFCRIVDLRNFDMVVEVFPLEDQANIISRLGVLNTWNPMKPDGYIEADIGRREERQIARMLVALAEAEPGKNFLDESFRWTRLEPRMPGWVLADTWFTEVQLPHRGILCVKYYSGEGDIKGEYKPDIELRLALTSTVVLCEADPAILEQYSEITFDRNHTEYMLGQIGEKGLKLDFTMGVPKVSAVQIGAK